MKKVLITGASGKVGRVLSRTWNGTYDLTLFDVVQSPPTSRGRVLRSDVNDINSVRDSLQGVSVVVHLAIGGNIEDSWEQVAPIAFTGTWAVFQAAAEAHCERVIFASSVMIDVAPSRPYSASKLWAEKLASRYAQLAGLSIICLRLGACAGYSDPVLSIGSRQLSHVLTYTDMARLFTCAVEAPASLRYGVYYGISNMKHPRMPMMPTRDALGFQPGDDVHALAWKSLLRPAGLAGMARRGLRKTWRRLHGEDDWVD